jgi:acetyl esterase/lipase
MHRFVQNDFKINLKQYLPKRKQNQIQMKFELKIAFLLIFTCANSIVFGQEKIQYKQVDSTQLFMKIFHAKKQIATTQAPAMIFFFGGGWKKGSIDQFEPHAVYFSKRGITCFLVDYRVKDRHQTTPFESLKDAKSALRFVRANAEQFQIDPSKIIAAGASAGGQLAAACAMVDGSNESTDNLNISCQPNALVLFNPAIDNGPGGVGYQVIGESYKDFSPLHNIKAGTPPTIIFLGTNDNLIPVETIKKYQTALEKVKTRCEVFLYEGQPHGFFNYKNFEYYQKTVKETDLFLQSLGYLAAEPNIEIE